MTTINVILANAKTPSFGSTTCEPIVWTVLQLFIAFSNAESCV
jgi:hypothetical protein